MKKILQLGNPILRKKSKRIPLKSIQSKDVQMISRKIIRLMKAIKRISSSHGNGLCAPQLGYPVRIIIIYHQEKFNIFINPQIIQKSKALINNREGCLSFFYLRSFVKRFKKITIKAYNNQGKKCMYNFSGKLAGLVQHEIDHLDAILYIDRIQDCKNLISIDELYDQKKLNVIHKIINYIT
ncbi:peptide deformylase [Patescibacteria group bacterium]|nr:peptide deformylase [Patescibacteria group bacterium]MBU1672856.1 peptide deformylase [Patescibacteria group bacterium]MBU1963723.1 peptide deformylase [Patescibacteria group bacterium]